MQSGDSVIPLDSHASARRFDTTLIRCLATILIVNSHLEAFYPRAWMAGDGLIGGTLFYVISGFSLAISDSSRPRPFLSWYWRRIWRILPSLLIAGVIYTILRGEWRTWRPIDYVTTLIWPTPYTFIQDIIPFYAIFYWIMRVQNPRIFPALLALMLVPYACVYAVYLRLGPDVPLLYLSPRAWLAQIFCFMGMLLGGWLARRVNLVRTNTPTDALIAVALFLVYLAAKFVVSVFHRFTQFYFVEAVASFALFYYLFKLAWSPKVDQTWRRNRITAPAVSFLGRLTLEIYLVHYMFTLPIIAAIQFPLNIIVLWAGTLPCAGALGLIADRVRSLVGQRRFGCPPATTPTLQSDIVSNAPGT